MSTPLHNEGIKPPTPAVTPPTTAPIANPAAEVASATKTAQAQAMAAPKSPSTPPPSSTTGTASINKAWSEKLLPKDTNVLQAVKTGVGKAFNAALKLFSATPKPVSAKAEFEALYQTQLKRAESLISIGRVMGALGQAVGFKEKSDFSKLITNTVVTKTSIETIYNSQSGKKAWDVTVAAGSLNARFENLSTEIGAMKKNALNVIQSDAMNSHSPEDRAQLQAEVKRQFNELENYHTTSSVYLQNRDPTQFGAEIKQIINKIQGLMEKAGVPQTETSQMQRAGFKEEDSSSGIKNGIGNLFTKML